MWRRSGLGLSETTECKQRRRRACSGPAAALARARAVRAAFAAGGVAPGAARAAAPAYTSPPTPTPTGPPGVRMPVHALERAVGLQPPLGAAAAGPGARAAGCAGAGARGRLAARLLWRVSDARGRAAAAQSYCAWVCVRWAAAAFECAGFLWWVGFAGLYRPGARAAGHTGPPRPAGGAPMHVRMPSSVAAHAHTLMNMCGPRWWKVVAAPQVKPLITPLVSQGRWLSQAGARPTIARGRAAAAGRLGRAAGRCLGGAAAGLARRRGASAPADRLSNRFKSIQTQGYAKFLYLFYVIVGLVAAAVLACAYVAVMFVKNGSFPNKWCAGAPCARSVSGCRRLSAGRAGCERLHAGRNASPARSPAPYGPRARVPHARAPHPPPQAHAPAARDVRARARRGVRGRFECPAGAAELPVPVK